VSEGVIIKLLKPAVGKSVISVAVLHRGKLIIYAKFTAALILCHSHWCETDLGGWVWLVGDGNLRVAHQRLLVRNLQRIGTRGLKIITPFFNSM
jgi:hypothetical protein